MQWTLDSGQYLPCPGAHQALRTFAEPNNPDEIPLHTSLDNERTQNPDRQPTKRSLAYTNVHHRPSQSLHIQKK